MKKIFSRFLAIILLITVLMVSTTEVIASAKALDNNGYIMLEIPWNYIQQCGNQVTSGNTKACQAYAFTYCRIILDNKYYPWTNYRNGNSGQTACAPGGAGYNLCTNTTSEQNVLKAIYDNINLGRPVMLRAKGSPLFHYVVAIGYKASCNPNALTQNDITILDPWDGIQKTLSSVPLKTTSIGNYGYWTAKSGGVSATNGDVKACTITFDSNGGSVSPSSKTLTAGTILTGMPTPTRSGYTFVGWTMDKIDPNSSTVQVSTIVRDGVFTFDKDTTLYAQWKRNCTNHTYDADTCTSCGAKLPYDNRFDASAAGTYRVSDNTAYVRTGPYQIKDLIRTASNGEALQVVGSVINSYNNIWLKTTDGYYVHADKLTKIDTTQPPTDKDSRVPPLPSGVPDGVYTLAPLCALGTRLDVTGADWRDNANVQIHESNGTLAQQWELTHLGNGYYSLICKASGKALDVSQAGTEPSTNVQQFTPNGTYAQQWRITNAADGSFFLIPRVNENLCLDVSGAGSINGTNVQIFTANGTEAQMWDLTPITLYFDS